MSITDLPPDIADQIHPGRRANEQVYWEARDGLLAEYGGLWVGFADGRVVASGRSPVAVLAAAEATGLRPYLTCVGREGEPERVRLTSFASEAGGAEPLPSENSVLAPKGRDSIARGNAPGRRADGLHPEGVRHAWR